MEDYDEQLAKAKAFHGEICGGIAIGTKLRWNSYWYKACNVRHGTHGNGAQSKT